jgi:hypothetical protein
VFPGKAGSEESVMIQDWKDRVRLEGILAALAGGMQAANLRNPGFHQKVSERHGIAEIRTEDGSVARRFFLSHGLLRSRRGIHPAPDYTMIYRDASCAVRVLLKGSQAAAMQAISDGKMKLEGDMVFGMWFNDLLQHAGDLMKNPRELLGA